MRCCCKRQAATTHIRALLVAGSTHFAVEEVLVDMESVVQRVSIRQLLSNSDQARPFRINGIVKSVYQTNINGTSLEVLDGSPFHTALVQIPKSLSVDKERLGPWATVEIKGHWQPDDSRIIASEVRILGTSESSSNPLNGRAIADGNHSHLRLRNPWHALLMRFRSEVVSAIQMTLAAHPEGPFHQVHHPVITFTDCEGGAEVFPVLTQQSKSSDALLRDSFFGGRRYLTVTAAIHGEAFTMGLDRVWMLAPCFRAERSQDDRYLAEFHMLEISMNYVEELESLLQLCEEVLRGVIETLRASPVAQELFEVVGRDDTTAVSAENLHRRWEMLTARKWPRMTHAEAMRMMEDAEATGSVKFEHPPGPEVALSTEHDLFLLDHFQNPVFVMHYPTKIRLFSLQSPAPQTSSQPQTTESVDLLLPTIGEVFSGGLREHRLERLVEVLREKGFFRFCEAKTGAAEGGKYPFLRDDESLDSLEWFADLRRWGTTYHRGFGIGFERLLKYLTGPESVRDVVAFPRYYGRCEA